MAISQSPTIVLVAGAWHSSTLWNQVRSELKPTHKTVAIDIPSVGGSPDIGPYEDAAVIAKELNRLIDQSQDVILVLHSYAGIPGSQACKGLGKRARTAEGKPGGIVTVIYVAAVTGIPGQSAVTPAGGKLAPEFDWNEETGLVYVKKHIAPFYSDLSEDVANEIIAGLQSQTYKSFVTPIDYGPYDDIDCTYLRCTMDAAIPPAIQDYFLELAGGREKIRVVDIEAAHSPMVSKPAETARLIVEAGEVASRSQG